MKSVIECIVFAALVALVTVGLFGLYAARVGHPIW